MLTKMEDSGKMSGVYTDFRNLKDEQLGTLDYRRSVRILEQSKENWIKRSDEEIVGSECPTRSVTKAEFGEKWPFRVDRVIIECRNNMFCIANINGYAFCTQRGCEELLQVAVSTRSGCRSAWEIGRTIHRDSVRTLLSRRRGASAHQTSWPVRFVWV